MCKLAETDIHSLTERQQSSQQSLLQYSSSDSTTVAVVREPRDTGIDELCDEWRPELGIPRDALTDYHKRRSAYDDASYISHQKACERAFSEANIAERYRQYIRSSKPAQQSLNELVGRLNSGERITLVCFEESGKPCHRHILKSILEQRQELGLTA